MSSVTINFVGSDFTSNKPLLGTYPSNLRIANINKVLDLGFNTYGVADFTITYSGSVDYISIIFSSTNGTEISVSTDQNSLYTQSNGVIYIAQCVVLNEDNSGSPIFYVVVNSDQTNQSRFLNLSIVVGKLKTSPPPVSSSVTITYDCPTPINIYEVGLHVYSPYDAIYSGAILKTYLYSLTDIGSWGNGTVVYSSPDLTIPALAYYYGYGDNVYKVGGPYDRAYGYENLVSMRKRTFGKTIVKKLTTPTQSYFDSVNQKSPACVFPIMTGLGIISNVYSNSSLIQPQEYRYYLGYDNSIETMSNDSVFVAYDWALNNNYPIIGSNHALGKILQGITSGYNTTFNLSSNLSDVLAKYTTNNMGNDLSKILPLLLETAAAGAGGTIIVAIIADIAIHAALTAVGACIACSAAIIQAAVASAVLTSLLIVGAIIAAIIIISVIIQLFGNHHTHYYYEPCTFFLHHFTNTPYIEIGDVLYRDPTLSVINNGYFCDGVYYYQQVGNVIISKELSYTNGLSNINPITFSLQYSIPADNPTLVRDIEKLIVLPYTSGKPLPYCGGGTTYYNVDTSTSITPSNCCAFEICSPFTVDIPAGTVFSCISQAAADNEAAAMIDSAVTLAESQGIYGTDFTDDEVGSIDAAFTHELKIENNPTYVSPCYDARSGATITTGTTLYFDPCGCTEVLDGYYAISGITTYRTFYHTTNGNVDGIYEMTLSGDTTTTTLEPIITTNIDHSSNWYLTRSTAEALISACSKMNAARTFNPNSLYSDPTLKKGFIDNPTTPTDLQLYNDFIGTSYNEAPSGWYVALIDWMNNDVFYYQQIETIILNIEEDCNYLTGSTTRGFYVTGNDGTYDTPTLYEVDLTVGIYTIDSGLTGTYNVKTSPSEVSTFVDYGSQVLLTDKVVSINILSIDSPNPNNRIIYTIGSTTTCLIPTAGLNLTFYDITAISGYTSVSTWNTLFDLPTNGTEFTSLQITGNTVNLMGGSGITIKDNLFSGNLYFPISIVDNNNCIEHLGNDVFYNCVNLTTVTLPVVLTVGNGAFYNCTALNGTLSLPLLTTAGNQSFYLCRSVLNFNLPLLNTVWDECFRYCYSVPIFNLPSLSSIGAGVFRDCDVTREFHLPLITSEAGNTFYNCSAAVIFDLPLFETATINTFYNCSSVIEFNLPSLTTAGPSTFYNCKYATTFNLPNLISSDWDSFFNCASATGFTFSNLLTGGTGSFAFCSSSTIFDFPIATIIGNGCFEYCISTTNINLPSVINMGTTVGDDYVFYGITGKTISYSFSSTVMTCNSGSTPDGDIQYLINNNITNPELLITFDHLYNAVFLFSGYSYTNVGAWNTLFQFPGYGNAFTSLQINGNTFNLRGGSNITIRDNLFANITHLISIVDTLGCITNVYSGGFSGCTMLNTIKLDSAVGIGNDAFKNCISMTGFTFANLTDVGNQAFYNCASLININLPSAVIIGNLCFYNCSGSTSFNLPSCLYLGSTTGNDGVFSGVTKNASLIVPPYLMTCYSGNPDGDITYLQGTTKSLSLNPKYQTSLTFDNITNADLMVGDSTNVNDWNIFFGISGTSSAYLSVTISGNTVNLIGGSNITLSDSLFGDNTYGINLLSITDNGSITGAGFNVFGNGDTGPGCGNLRTVNLIGLTTAGSYCFADCISLTGVTLPILSTAGDYCFFYNTGMTSFYLTNLTTAGTYCFAYNSSVININLLSLTDAGDYCFAAESSIINFNLPSLMTAGVYCFTDCSVTTGFTLTGATTIGDYCFNNCYNSTEYILSSCTNLGSSVGLNYVFNDISGKTISITVPSALMTCNTGSTPDGDIQSLVSNNTVTITTV